MNLAIDIDWILTMETDWHDYKHRTPNMKNIKILNTIAKKHNIILFTARDIVDKKITIEWLNKHKVKYDDIIFNKPKYDYLVDDRSIADIKNLLYIDTM